MAKYRSGVQTTFGFLPTIAPTAPREGEMYYNDVDNAAYLYNGTTWVQLDNAPFSASGGTITTYTGFKVHSFTSGGTLSISGTTGRVDILMVGAGGGGGGGIGGGGGAGGMIVQAGRTLGTGDYTIAIGTGGTTGAGTGGIGGDSTITYGGTAILTALGGGLGATNGGQGGDGGSGGSQGNAARTGGSGIQTSSPSISADSRTYGFGNKGGDSLTNPSRPGGGGGALVAGTDGPSGQGHGAVGGAGKTNSYRTDSNVTYAGGGGGGAYNGGAGSVAGGAGGGGAGGGQGQVGTAGGANLGGGGGGGGYIPAASGGTGGSGIVVIRYAV